MSKQTIQFIVIVFFTTLITQVDGGWWWKPKRKRSNTTPFPNQALSLTPPAQTRLSPTAISKTASVSTRSTCQDIPDDAWLCHQHVNYSCTYSILIQEYIRFRNEKLKGLDDLDAALKNNSNSCRNVTIEIFCHYFLPKCNHLTENMEGQQCAGILSNQPGKRLLPCQGYCEELVKKCLKPFEAKIANIFDGINTSEICNQLPNESCWKNPQALSEVKTVSSQNVQRKTTANSTTHITSVGLQTAITITICICLVIIAVLAAIVVVWRCYKMRHTEAKDVPTDQSQINCNGPQMVYNEIYVHGPNASPLYSTVVKNEKSQIDQEYQNVSILENQYTEDKEKPAENEYAMAEI